MAKKRRRPRGSGSVYKKGRIWMFAYPGPDGLRHVESSGSTRKGDAERLARKRVGAREHNLPVVAYAERLTFDEAARSAITHYEINKKPSLPVFRRRIELHLTPFFTGRRLAGIPADDINIKYVAHRQREGIIAWKGPRKGQRIRDVSNTEINHELKALKLIFNREMKNGRIGSMPHIRMLDEPPPRTGFLEPAQAPAVLSHLPEDPADAAGFGYITGWRLEDEVFPLTWPHIDFKAEEVRLFHGESKNREPRVFPFTAELRRILEARWVKHEKLKKAGIIEPHVFFRMVGKRGGKGEPRPRPIKSIRRAWNNACRAAGVPGRLPHDMRRSAVRNLDRAGVSRTVAMAMVGHKTESIYARYNITSNADKHEAARKLDIAAANHAQRAAKRS